MKYLYFFSAVFSTFNISGQTIDKAALQKLIARAKETHSSALAIYHNDKLIYNQCFDSAYFPIDAMSATKSIVNLAIGLLVTNGKIKSIDEPVSTYYSEWNQGTKKEITIRHLLNHTSGLQANRMTKDIYEQPDYVQYALNADIANKPGTRFFYNNKACNLLVGIVKKAGGIRVDSLVNENIFKPLGIKNFSWWTDSYVYQRRKNGVLDSTMLTIGNPIGMAELIITAEDLAKVGLLVLHKGNWQGKQIISKTWLNESLKPSQPYNNTCGLLWWLMYDPTKTYVTFDSSNVAKLKSSGINDTILNQLSTIIGRYNTVYDFTYKLQQLSVVKEAGGLINFTGDKLFSKSVFDPIYTLHIDGAEVTGYAARGSLGQKINIFPRKKLVVVRTISSRKYKVSEDNFYDFDELSYEVVK